MIVYGDSAYHEQVSSLAARLRARVCVLPDASAGHASMDALRESLVFAGQVEQALEDAGHLFAPPVRAVTDALAALFVQGIDAAGSPDPEQTARIARLLSASDGADPEVRVVLPEGFAYHALYPEQVAAAARRWAADHGGARGGPVLVLGLRSIGTTLSAVARAALQAMGFQTERMSARPEGHPFRRTLKLPPSLAAPTFALIVDEGPGLSGSSMAAAAEAVMRLGLERERIAFLPSHPGEPGVEASDEIRRWWAGAPRYPASEAGFRPGGGSLEEALAAESARWFGVAQDAVTVTPVDAGGWRAHAFASEAEWPAVCAAFEKPKRLCILPDGRRMLWKFRGFADRGPSADLPPRLSGGVVRPVTVARVAGYEATVWVDGPRIRADACTSGELRAVGTYVALAAGSPLPAEEEARGRDRLGAMVRFNVEQALGEELARRAEAAWDAQCREPAGWPTYGDGRIAPFEFIRRPDGGLVKAGAGDGLDHTVVGRQPVLWDFAAALEEFDAEGQRKAAVLAGFGEGGGRLPSEAALRAWRIAYSAFKVGQTTLCRQSGREAPEELPLLDAARQRYLGRLQTLLRASEARQGR
jgi:hypothetical protein